MIRIFTLISSLIFVHAVSMEDTDWRQKKIEAYQKAHGKKDKHGNREGRAFDLGGESRLDGRLTLLVLTEGDVKPVTLDSNLVKALKRRIEVQYIPDLPRNENDFEKMLSDTTQIWVWAGQDPGCLPPSHLEVIKKKIKHGMSAFLLADNTPFTRGIDDILKTVSSDSAIEGNYVGKQIIRATNVGPGFEGKHPLFHGISKLYEGDTVSTIIGTNLRTIARSTDGNSLICVSQSTPNQGKILVTGGFTALMDQYWDTAGTERFALNAAAFLAGIEK